jgi:hypothetical protein
VSIVEEMKVELVEIISPLVDEIIRIAPDVTILAQDDRDGVPGTGPKFLTLLGPLMLRLVEASPKIVIAFRKNQGLTLQ